jgi:hypothetical protein
MNSRWTKYRLIIFVLIIIGLFVSRTVLPLFKKVDTSAFKPLSTEINRNISNLILTKHARCRMECRDITEDEIKEILHDGNINYMKSDINNERGQTYALEGYSHEHQHLRVIFAPKNDEMVVVTCIDLDKEWHCDCN